MYSCILATVFIVGVLSNSLDKYIQLSESFFGSEGDYNNDVIPGPPGGGPLELEIGLMLINLDLDKQIASGTAWVRMRWNDYRLTWDPTDFDGIEVIRTNTEHLWTPDLEVYNAAQYGDNSFHSWMHDNSFESLVHHNGTVDYIPALPFQAICEEADLTLPKEAAQKCKIKIGSWTFSGKQLEVEPYHSYETKEILDYIDMSEMKNSNWVVTSQKDNIKKTQKYPGYPEDYFHMEYDFHMQRAYIEQPDGSVIENPSLPQPLSTIYSKYRAGENMVE